MRKRTQILSGLTFLISLLLTCCQLPQHHRDLSEVMQDQLRRELNVPRTYPWIILAPMALTEAILSIT